MPRKKPTYTSLPSTAGQDLLLPNAPDWAWQRDAACRGEDLALFFPGDGERAIDRQHRERAAKEMCAGCPVRVPCLDYAVSRPERYGVWGGMGDAERDGERRRRQRRARAA